MNTPILLNSLFQLDSLITWLVIGALILTGVTIYTVINAKLILNDSYAVREPAKTNFAGVLLGMLGAAVGISYLLVTGLAAQWGMLNTLMFAAFPYVCLFIFLIGSVYRYMNRGFQVSSLSSEFLERKKLFWGSQPFHYGLLVLFFGHLIAFLFPSAVLAWNGEPVRLLILEFSSFAFGLAALAGLILLIKRRLSNKRILIVSNKMDMLVYTVLLMQIVTGLGVAFFVRWGSSWFASAITPYLRSIFALNPDIAAVSAMPWWVQLHIISAFFILAIVPFTRFVHFLVAPIDYLWRGYQLVIWNWNRKTIRKSGSYFPGFRAKNN
jgi:nitrate reductase gamma subunit